jgi:hypothetical protein
MPVFLSDHHTATLDRAMVALHQLLDELNGMRKHFTAEAETDRDRELVELIDAAFTGVYGAHCDLRLISEFPEGKTND